MNPLSTMEYLYSAFRPLELEVSAAEVAFVGRSNVGKSTVINALCERKKLAHTSQVPGKTRAMNIYGTPKHRWLVDLPGYGFATGRPKERAAWQKMIEGYLTNRPTLRRVYVIIDGFVGATALDKQMVLWLGANAIPYTIVANKIDKISVPQRPTRHEEVVSQLGVGAEDIFWVSAERGFGISELRTAVVKVLKL